MSCLKRKLWIVITRTYGFKEKKVNEVKMFKKSIFLLIFLFSTGVSAIESHKQDANQGLVDIFVVSYDRPLQLYAFLESVERYVKGVSEIQIIYRTSNDAFAKAYKEVMACFPQATFTKQGPQPEQDFKPLVLKAVFGSSSKYIISAVDDIIVTDYINLHECVASLEATGAYAFYLRLGKNITESYMTGIKHGLPPFTQVADGILSWRFMDNQSSWRYPNNYDFTLYRKTDIKVAFERLHYRNPNTHEASWCSVPPCRQRGLCYERSKMVNIPLNLVQDVCKQNRNMNLLSVQELLNKFNEGLKIDIDPLYQVRNISPHMEYIPTLISR